MANSLIATKKNRNINSDDNSKANNVLISGQTFYKFSRKNTDKTERKSTKIGNNSFSKNIIFDIKTMNNYLMPKTM